MEDTEEMEQSERYSLMEDEDWKIRGGSIWNSTQERTTTRVKCRATTCQLVQLVKFMEKHPELAVSHAKPIPDSDQLWMKLAEHINQFGPPKTYRQCKTTWRDLRKRALSMQVSRSKNATGRNLYGMAPKILSLLKQVGVAPRNKEKGSARSSKPDTPAQPEPVDPPAPEEDPCSKTEKTKGEELVIRVTDELNSKRNVCNRFTISDGHFENIIVKEEMLEANQEDEDPDPDPELEDEANESEELFPQPEAILGNTDEVMEEKHSVIRELNETLRKFLTEYKTRNALMRERIDLERARLQFDMEVHRNRQMEKRVIAVNANASVMNNINALSVANSGSASNIAGTANNVITVNSSIANAVNTASVVKSKPVITLNALSTGNSGIVKIENTVRNANVTSSENIVNSTSVAKLANSENVAEDVDDAITTKVEDLMDET